MHGEYIKQKGARLVGGESEWMSEVVNQHKVQGEPVNPFVRARETFVKKCKRHQPAEATTASKWAIERAPPGANRELKILLHRAQRPA